MKNKIKKYLKSIGYTNKKIEEMFIRHQHKGKRGAIIIRNIKGNKTLQILNLGCGPGLNHKCVSQILNKSKIHGIDTDTEAIKLCKLYNPKERKIIKKYNGNKIPYHDNKFDAIIFDTVIEHVEKPKQLIKEIYRVLKRDGILYITTANKYWPIEPHYNLLFLSYLPKKIAKQYMKIKGLKQGYDDINLPSYREFNQLLNKFEVKDVTFEIMSNPANKKASMFGIGITILGIAMYISLVNLSVLIMDRCLLHVNKDNFYKTKGLSSYIISLL
jgi:ubiquinone/menaquinone biosynthesis C-methylase UbiE